MKSLAWTLTIRHGTCRRFQLRRWSIMAVTGEAELMANLERLEKTEEAKARKATRDGAKVFEERLKANTPVSNEDHSGKTPLRGHTKRGNLKTTGGRSEEHTSELQSRFDVV